MHYLKHIFYLLLLLSGVSYAQLNNDTIVKYKNGKTKLSVNYKNADTLQRIHYFPSGQIKDSTWYKVETFVAVKTELDKRKALADSIVIKNRLGVGTSKKYYKNGNLKSITYYAKDELSANRTMEYSKKRKLAAFKETPFGLKILYNNKGKITRYANTNKGTQVYVPKKFSSALTASNRIKTKTAYLKKDKKQVKISSGALISLQLNSDTTKYNNCLVEGFNGDSIYLSKFEYDLDPETKNKLKYDSTFVLHGDQISSLFYSKKNTRHVYKTASILEISGMDLIIVPTVVLPISGGAQTFPAVAACIAAGIPMVVYSKYLFRKMAPKEYKMREWSLKH